MPTRTIALAEDAYEALFQLKHPGESFSDIVRRLTRRRSLTELADIMDRPAGDAVAAAVEANRNGRTTRRRRELGLS